MTVEAEEKWASAIERLHFLRKLFWFRDDDTPFMIRDETELHRDFFGGSSKRKQCLSLVNQRADLVEGLSVLYSVPKWTLEHLHRVRPSGPWFRDQGLPKLLRLLGRHDPINAPVSDRELRSMVQIFDVLLLDRHRESSEAIEPQSLRVLKALYASDKLSLLEEGLISLRLERMAWTKVNSVQLVAVDVHMKFPSIGAWLLYLESRAHQCWPKSDTETDKS